MPWGVVGCRGVCGVPTDRLKYLLDGKIYIILVPRVVKTIIVPLKYFFDGKYILVPWGAMWCRGVSWGAVG